MREISFGERKYRIIVAEREGDWTARAERVDTGDSFGIVCAGPSEAAATDHLAEWLIWQHEHSSALEALQQAERAYHRTIAGSAFAGPGDEPDVVEAQNGALEQVDDARVRLDEIRARKPG